MKASLNQRWVSEFVATGLLAAAVVGSGIMSERLAGGNPALALLANAIATGAALVALICAFGEISGAHMNPVVSLSSAAGGLLPWREARWYGMAQLAGGICGTMLANTMFSLPLVTVSRHGRSGAGQILSECVASFGLLCVIRGAGRKNSAAVPLAAGAYITAAYWFTASTSFANPAVTVARTLSDTFTGIRPGDAPLFILAQIAGGAAATALWSRLWPAGG